LRDFKTEAEALFDSAATSELVAMLGIKGEAATKAFQTELIDLCAHFHEVIATLPCDLPSAPFNLSLTKRADWLEANVVKPGQRLLEAIQTENRPMFSTWPYPLDPPKFRDNMKLMAELSELVAEADELRQGLRNQQAEDAGHSQELRQEVFSAIARLLQKHCPDVKPNRGVYDPDLRRRIGVYVDAMRLIFGKITGVEENLDRLIRSEMHYPS
jgi:hypothetical protein